MVMQEWLAFRRLEQQIEDELSQELKQLPHEISLNEFHTLYCLAQSQGQKLQMTDLSEQIGLSLSATSRMLVRFEQTCGVIERHTCLEDKRAVEIYLTELGKERLAEVEKALEPIFTRYQGILEIFQQGIQS